MGKSRLFIFGIDGGDFGIIDPMVAAGRLPNISALMERGARGPLASTFPPVTGPAWVSFMTGVNPGRHGIFDFHDNPPRGWSYERGIVGTGNIRVKTLWQRLSEAGLRVGALAVPMTYPPLPVNGFMVSGFGTPGDKSDFTYPPSLYSELVMNLGEYWFDMGMDILGYEEGRELEYLKRVHDVEGRRAEAMFHLMDSRPWDVFMAVFAGTDHLQHFFWKYMDEAHPSHEPVSGGLYGDVIRAYYQKVDGLLGDAVKRLGPDDYVMVVSDHGGGALRKKLYVNRWLEEQGLLTIKDAVKEVEEEFEKLVDVPLEEVLEEDQATYREAVPYKSVNMLLGMLSTVERKLRGLTGKKGLTVKRPRFVRELVVKERYKEIDWEATSAYSGYETEMGVYVNLAGRCPAGTVEPGGEYEKLRDRLIDGLLGITDPQTGGRVVEWAKRREEVFHGPMLDKAPDVVFMTSGMEYIPYEDLDKDTLFEVSGWRSGTHRPHGIFMLAGPGVRRGAKVEGAGLVDMTPTVLHLMGMGVPSHMDGSVVTGALEEGFLKETPVRTFEEQEHIVPETGGLDDEESRAVEERLKSLGYM